MVKKYKRRRELFSEGVRHTIEKMKFEMVVILRRMKAMKIEPVDVDNLHI
jgi:hypothetical protein